MNKLKDRTISLLKTIYSIVSVIATFLGIVGWSMKDLNSGPSKELLSFAVAIALLVGLAVYTGFWIIGLIVRSTFRQEHTELIANIANLEKEVNILSQRIFIHEVINIERLAVLYPSYYDTSRITDTLGAREITTAHQVNVEVNKVRENFRINRDKYNVSLDLVEDELTRLYGSFLVKG